MTHTHMHSQCKDVQRSSGMRAACSTGVYLYMYNYLRVVIHLGGYMLVNRLLAVSFSLSLSLCPCLCFSLPPLPTWTTEGA